MTREPALFGTELKQNALATAATTADERSAAGRQPGCHPPRKQPDDAAGLSRWGGLAWAGRAGAGWSGWAREAGWGGSIHPMPPHGTAALCLQPSTVHPSVHPSVYPHHPSSFLARPSPPHDRGHGLTWPSGSLSLASLSHVRFLFSPPAPARSHAHSSPPVSFLPRIRQQSLPSISLCLCRPPRIIVACLSALRGLFSHTRVTVAITLTAARCDVVVQSLLAAPLPLRACRTQCVSSLNRTLASFPGPPVPRETRDNLCITTQFSCPLRLLPPVLLFLKPSTLLRHPRSSRFAKRLSTGHSRRPATIESYRFVVEALPQHSFLSCALHHVLDRRADLHLADRFFRRANQPDDVAMSNVTGGTAPPAVTPTTPVPTQSTPQQPTTPPTPSSSSPSPTPPTTSSTPTPTTPSSSSTPPTTSSTPPPTTSSTPPPTTSSTPITSSTPPTTSSSSTPEPTTSLPPTTVVTETPSTTSTAVTTVIRTTTPLPSSSSPSATTSSTSTPTPNDQAGSGSGGLSQGSKVAIGVVVPIAAIAILAILGLFWWKKRRARQEAEEQRRKEVEDYAYNPNADPTIPAVGLAADNSYEMREDGGSGYRGWGSTTAAGSTGRKASTTMSGGMPGGAYSDVTSPTRVANSEARSGEPLLDGSSSPDGEILGAMGPSAANNRGGDVRRGPSNASSSYSAAGRSEGSDGGVYGNGGGGGAYYDQYAQNPYSDQRPQELPGQAVIRDNPARRNTRIENPAHYPQQSAGIAQNF
ncbi:hypothetical protein Purlil1_8256 [Purpureocillium lilacinum]|uniref:Uncharacterized protein n=1 Tax=Purpureocillium lilacinum TaxID=33203 RepID=A0ABR0BVB1_PURLI|nr:hypothetical protein Purlil1_8256 [Purpureocillium lilacinum]